MWNNLLKFNIFFLIIVFGTNPVHAQVRLNSRINFTIENASVSNALSKLADEQELSLAFSEQFFSKNKKINLDLKQVKLVQVLEEILKESEVGFRFQNQQLVLFQKRKNRIRERTFTVNGYVEEAANSEKLIGVNVYHKPSGKWATTNEYGFYSITLPEGNVALTFSYLGCKERVQALKLQETVRLDVGLESAATLAEVIVIPEMDSSKINTLANEGQLMPPNYTKIAPGIGGESDIVGMAATLPGVQTGVDGLGGMYVRGGEAGQNLMLLDGVPIYNPSHLMGIFSVYNTDAIRSARLLKGQFPARYGGRISSVFDVRSKEGNQKEWTSRVGLGLISGKASVEGPLFDGKGGMLLAGRRTHSNYFLDQIFQTSLFGGAEDYGFNFYDLNAKIHYSLSEKDRLFLSYYKGKDSFDNSYVEIDNSFDGGPFFEFEDETILEWGNEIAALRWNRIWGARLFSNTTVTYSDYQYQNSNFSSYELQGVPDMEEFEFFSDHRTRIKDLAAKMDFDFIPNPDHVMRFGMNFIKHSFTPYAISSDDLIPQLDDQDSLDLDDLTKIYEERSFSSLEAALYVEDEFKWNEHWQVNTGLRASSLFGKRGTFVNLEPRLSLNYFPSKKLSLKIATSKMVQYLQQVSLNSLSLPDDIWLPASVDEPPLESWLFEVGLTKKFNKQFAFSLDGYYKKMDNLLSLQVSSANSTIAINEDFSLEGIIVGKGQAYGLEAMLQKEGKTGGWISYTLSKTQRQYKGSNLGQPYDFRFDRRHNINAFLYHQFNPNWHISFNWIYSSANPKIILDEFSPYIGPDGEVVIETDQTNPFTETNKNVERGKNYHRLDFNLSYQFTKRKTQHVFKLGAFNVYNKSNPAFYQKTVSGFGTTSSEPVTLLHFTPSFYYQLRF